MRFGNCHADRPEFASVATEAPGSRHRRKALKHMPRQVLGGCVGAIEVRHLVEISIVDGLENRFQRLVCAANIDDDSVGVESVGNESCVNYKGRAVDVKRAVRISQQLRDHPLSMDLGGTTSTVDYEPAESTNFLFGGNSNWRGPVWFPLNYLLIEALDRSATPRASVLVFVPCVSVARLLLRRSRHPNASPLGRAIVRQSPALVCDGWIP